MTHTISIRQPTVTAFAVTFELHRTPNKSFISHPVKTSGAGCPTHASVRRHSEIVRKSIDTPKRPLLRNARAAHN